MILALNRRTRASVIQCNRCQINDSCLEHRLEPTFKQDSFLKQRSRYDWSWALLVSCGTLFAFSRYSQLMDAYEAGILFSSGLISIWLGRLRTPVSNLYEIFILFSIITALLYLCHEYRYNTRSPGGFVLPVFSAAIGFLLWHTFEKQAHENQPLVPALPLLEDVIYKAIALGFDFFTLATILGALWTSEAWGGYWSWDPQETWALIVWLNYAAWLHLRLTKGWHGKPMAWWSIIGFFVTLFAYLGANLFLSGLHSYGEL